MKHPDFTKLANTMKDKQDRIIKQDIIDPADVIGILIGCKYHVF